MKQTILTTALICFSLLGFAQNESIDNHDNYVSLLVDNSVLPSQKTNDILFIFRESLLEEDKKTIFLNKDWNDGYIITYKNEKHKFPVRYNVTNNEMQILYKDKTKALYPEKVKGVRFDNTVFVSSSFIKNSEIYNSFFELLSSGKMITLLLRYETNIPSATNEATNQKVIKDYYIKYEDAPAEKIDLKKKTILKLFKKQGNKINDFIQKNKIDFKRKSDLTKLFDYYNSL